MENKKRRLRIIAAAVLAALAAASAHPAHAAEVSASKPPVQLTLRVAKTRIKAGESIWYQIELKNIGDQPLVSDRIFGDPRDFDDSLRINHEISRGIFLKALGPNGKKLDWETEFLVEGCRIPEFKMTPVTGTEKVKIDAVIAKARADGLSGQGIQERLDEYSRQKAELKKDAERLEKSKKLNRLAPGETVTTPPWVYPGICNDRKPLPAPIGPYAELWHLKLDKPGTYRIKAVYDRRPSDTSWKYLRSHHKAPDPDEIRVATRDILVEVVK